MFIRQVKKGKRGSDLTRSMLGADISFSPYNITSRMNGRGEGFPPTSRTLPWGPEWGGIHVNGLVKRDESLV